MMSGAFDQLQAGTGQGLCQVAGRAEGNQLVGWVSEQQYGRPDQGDDGHHLVQFAHQGTLLGQEGPPQPAAVAVRLSPDLPVDMLAGGQRPGLPPGEPGQPGPGDPWCQPPRGQGAQRPCAWCGQQPVPRVHTSWAYARQQDYRLDPVRRQAGRCQCHPAAVGVAHEHRALDAT